MQEKNEDVIKRAVISGASRALKYKEENPRKGEGEIMQMIVNEIREIISEIDKG
jgi:hypothetical protein